MTKYYHIHRGTTPTSLEKGFIKGRRLFFSKKNSFWYNTEIDISKDYGGYKIYEINIPNNLMTLSLHPKNKKVVKINKNNVDDFMKLKKIKIGDALKDMDDIIKRNIIGFIFMNRESNANYPEEGYIFEKIKGITVRLIDTVYYP